MSIVKRPCVNCVVRRQRLTRGCDPSVVFRFHLCGLLGSVRVQTAPSYYAVLEAKPAHRVPDLGFPAWPPFNGLKDVASLAKNLDEMEDAKEHSHMPFVVILPQGLEKFRPRGRGSPTRSRRSRTSKTWCRSRTRPQPT